MGLWNFYFLAKLYLYFKGFIRLGFVWNLLFWVLLLWSDSWFPPLLDSIAFLNQQGWPTKEYVYRFFLGVLNPWELIVLVFILIFCIAATKYIRLTPVVIILLLIVPLNEIGQPKEEADRHLAAFYKSESKRVIHFENAKTGYPDFV